MNKAITFFKQNIISTIIICISILGLLFEIIGAFAFCSSTDVGMNMKVFTNAMVIIGIIFVSISFIASIEETIRYKIKKLEGQGLCGCVYTQWSDIEDEINGIYTYDREVNKLS